MTDRTVQATGAVARTTLDPGIILNALPIPSLAFDTDLRVHFVNPAAEQLFALSAPVLTGSLLSEHFSEGSPFLSLTEQVVRQGGSITEHGIRFETAKASSNEVDLHVAALDEVDGLFLMTVTPRSIAQMIDRQLVHRGAARSIAGLAAILAHEVKNPLSGIRGAAQLLEQNADAADRELTTLIRDETDRICALVDEMEGFSDPRPLVRQPENIHKILHHVVNVAANGFASHVRFEERYDPSLPPVAANRDRLIQVFINLVKNAAEALPADGGKIEITTAYRHGVRMTIPGTTERIHLPLEICISDNGDGIPEELRDHLFDPFVTTKQSGTGLGLALVAKFIGDHGGTVDYENLRTGTKFRVLLPIEEGSTA